MAYIIAHCFLIYSPVGQIGSQNNDRFPGKSGPPAPAAARAAPGRHGDGGPARPGVGFEVTVPQAAEAATVIKVAGGTGST